MSMRLQTFLPIMGWKRVQRLTPQEAATYTNGNTDKFMNKDYWTLNGVYKSASDIPTGERAVYYHDGAWWLMEKVR